MASREARHEHVYEALLAAGRTTWATGERVRIVRTVHGARLVTPDDDPRDYDVDHYARILREQYASRFSRALEPDVYAATFADPDQLELFVTSLADAKPILAHAMHDPDRWNR
jgi:hypothetical protein